ncbi:hypothetical protein Tco_1215148, partial [Tanacetum coccineum]
MILSKGQRVLTKDLYDSLMAQLNKKSNENADVLAQIQKKGFAIAALKNELRKLTGNSVNTKFAKPSILGKPVGQPLKNQSVVRQPTAFKSERPRISKPRFASQVDVNNDLSKPVTTHHLPKGRESAPAKPHHMIAPSSSRYSSNDIVHNHYLEEAKKKAQEHSRNSRNFSDSKHFVCSTCQKCVFNANHDACVIKFLKEVNSRAKVQTRKTFASSTTKVESEPPNGSNADIPNQCESEQALNVSAADQASVFMAMMSDHNSSDLAPQRQMVSAENNTSGPVPQCSKRRLIVADQASVFMAMTSDHNRSELGIQDHSNEQTSSKLVPKVVPLAVKTATSRQELELLFHHHIAMLRTTEHPSDTNVFTMKMEILLEPASNKLLV